MGFFVQSKDRAYKFSNSGELIDVNPPFQKFRSRRGPKAQPLKRK